MKWSTCSRACTPPGAGRWASTRSWLRLILTFLVPVAFAVTVPAEALTGRLTVLTLLGGAGAHRAAGGAGALRLAPRGESLLRGFGVMTGNGFASGLND